MSDIDEEIKKMLEMPIKEKELIEKLGEKKYLELHHNGDITNIYFSYEQVVDLISGIEMWIEQQEENMEEEEIEEMDKLLQRLQGYMLLMQSAKKQKKKEKEK